jgi:hypothetical protein
MHSAGLGRRLRIQEGDVSKSFGAHAGPNARWRLGIAACGLLLLSAASAFATQIKPGQTYQGRIVACGTEKEANTLLGFVTRGDYDKAKRYLQADGNTCGVGSTRFIPERRIGETRTDPKGNVWTIVKIALPTTEAFLVTTADFVPGLST